MSSSKTKICLFPLATNNSNEIDMCFPLGFIPFAVAFILLACTKERNSSLSSYVGQNIKKIRPHGRAKSDGKHTFTAEKQLCQNLRNCTAKQCLPCIAVSYSLSLCKIFFAGNWALEKRI